MRFYDYYNTPTKVLLGMLVLVDMAGLSILGVFIAR